MSYLIHDPTDHEDPALLLAEASDEQIDAFKAAAEAADPTGDLELGWRARETVIRALFLRSAKARALGFMR